VLAVLAVLRPPGASGATPCRAPGAGGVALGDAPALGVRRDAGASGWSRSSRGARCPLSALPGPRRFNCPSAWRATSSREGQVMVRPARFWTGDLGFHHPDVTRHQARRGRRGVRVRGALTLGAALQAFGSAATAARPSVVI
jgi:hypothetical protein